MQFKWNEKINQVTENTLVVGMDIAKRVHYACFVDERGRVIEKASTLANGVKFGRPSIEITGEFILAYDKWQAGKITAVEAMEVADMKKSSFYKMIKEHEALVIK